MSTITKKFNGNFMALCEQLHGTASDLLDYAESAGLITEAHGKKKIATHKWRCAVTDLFSPTGCLRAFEPYLSGSDNKAHNMLKLNFVKLLSTLHKNYCKKNYEGNFALAIEERGYQLWNDRVTSSAPYHRQQCRAANQEQGLCHRVIQSPSLPASLLPILSPPATRPAMIARSIQTSITPSQSNTRSQPVHSLVNCQDPYLPTNTNLKHVNGHETDLQPRVHLPVDKRTATRHCVSSNRSTSSMESDDDTTIMEEIIEEGIVIIGRRPELQIPNPRPNNRQRIERVWPQPINSRLQFLDNGATQLQYVCSTQRQELRTTGPAPINVTPTRETLATMASDYYVDQTQALVNQTQALANLANALHKGQNFMTGHSRNRTSDIFNSILDRIENEMMTNRNEIEI